MVFQDRGRSMLVAWLPCTRSCQKKLQRSLDFCHIAICTLTKPGDDVFSILPNALETTTKKESHFIIEGDDTKVEVWRDDDGLLHRDSGPAVIYPDGEKEWYILGKRTRVEKPDGTVTESLNFSHDQGPRYDKVTEPDGTVMWFKDNDLHRTDGPAQEELDGTTQWWQNGKLHREDGPAWEKPNGNRMWLQNGDLHRIDGPAIEGPGRFMQWWLHGVQHREGGPAWETLNGDLHWLHDGFLHRRDGPASEYADGSRSWYFRDELHRTDGPAVIKANGETEYWMNGQNITGAVNAWMAELGWPSYAKWNSRHRVMFILRWQS